MKMKTRTNQPVEGDEIENLKVSGELKAFENIVDKDGHLRFIEGEGAKLPSFPEGFEVTYSKWSLSGSHLMVVMSGTIAANTSITTLQVFKFDIPKWIYDKLIPSTSSYLDYKVFSTTSSGFTTQDTFSAILTKQPNANEVRITLLTKNFANADAYYRIAFDFIIDNE